MSVSLCLARSSWGEVELCILMAEGPFLGWIKICLPVSAYCFLLLSLEQHNIHFFSFCRSECLVQRLISSHVRSGPTKHPLFFQLVHLWQSSDLQPHPRVLFKYLESPLMTYSINTISIKMNIKDLDLFFNSQRWKFKSFSSLNLQIFSLTLLISSLISLPTLKLDQPPKSMAHHTMIPSAQEVLTLNQPGAVLPDTCIWMPKPSGLCYCF